MTLTVKIVQLDKETRSPSDPYELIIQFVGVTALTDALIHWDDNNCHKQGGLSLLVCDHYNEVPLRLSKQLFEEL